MKDVIKATLVNGDFAYLQASALVIFFAVMVGVFLWIHRPGSKAYYQEVGLDAIKGED